MRNSPRLRTADFFLAPHDQSRPYGPSLPPILPAVEGLARECAPLLVVVRFPRLSWPTFTRLPSPLCSLHTSRGCNLRLTERKPKGSDRVVTRSVHIGSLNEETRRRYLCLARPFSLPLSLHVRFHLATFRCACLLLADPSQVPVSRNHYDARIIFRRGLLDALASPSIGAETVGGSIN